MTHPNLPPLSSGFSPLDPPPLKPPHTSEAAYGVVQEAILELWQVVNGLSTIEPPARDRYRVTVFGSARVQPETPIYEDVRRLARELTKLGCDIVTGGGPGLMAAANEGSVTADPCNRTRSIGIRVDLATEQEVNPFVEEVFRHRTFFSRLHHFVLMSDAFVVVPGGIGTALEALMIWQLLQVRSLHHTPLIMVGEMWQDLVQWAKESMIQGDYQLADPEDMHIPRCVDSLDEAITLLRIAHQEWQKRQATAGNPDV